MLPRATHRFSRALARQCLFCEFEGRSEREIEEHCEQKHPVTNTPSFEDAKRLWKGLLERNARMYLSFAGERRKPMTLPKAEEGTGISGFPFIKGDDIPKGKKLKAKIISPPVEAPREIEFSDLLVDILVNGKKYTLGLRLASPNYRTLLEKFGREESKWVGKTFELEQRYTKKYKKNIAAVVP